MRFTSVGADIGGAGDGTGKEYMHETTTEKVTGRCEKNIDYIYRENNSSF